MRHLYFCSLVFCVVLMGCNAGPNKPNIEIVQNMMDQVSIKSQDWSPEKGEVSLMLQPPPGAIPRGQSPYKFINDPGGAARDVNPLKGNMSATTLTLGRKYYDVYCAVCHGSQGDSVAAVADLMAVKPRNLLSDDALKYTDGRIHYAIVAGIGVMGPYASQIPDATARWAVVNYVRSLQKQKK